jgi:hypothetical protein
VKIEQYKQRVHDQLNQRFYQIGTVGKLALLLDPRTKDLPVFGQKFRQECENALQQECLAIAKDLQQKAQTNPNSDNTLVSKKKKLQSLLEESVSSKPSSQSNNLNNYVQLELLSYLRMPNITLEENPLLWWKAHQHLFPTLNILARKYLCIPATSAPSERLFSVGSNIVTDNRHSLSPEHIRSLMFLHDNLDLIE